MNLFSQFSFQIYFHYFLLLCDEKYEMIGTEADGDDKNNTMAV